MTYNGINTFAAKKRITQYNGTKGIYGHIWILLLLETRKNTEHMVRKGLLLP
jgi:hypothetical protein